MRAQTGFRERFITDVGHAGLSALRYVSQCEETLPPALLTRFRGALREWELRGLEIGAARRFRVACVHSSQEHRETAAARERALAAQRRYEAMRAYFVDGLTASEVAERFGYSPASVHQMASELRAGSAQYFRSSKPGPRSARKADRVRDRVLELRALDRSVQEIAAECTLAGSPVSAQTVWTILHAEGIERLPRRTGSDGSRKYAAPPRIPQLIFLNSIMPG